MPEAPLMNFSRSRTLPVKWRSSGSRDAGLSVGSGCIPRARSRIESMAGFGRPASICAISR